MPFIDRFKIRHNRSPQTAACAVVLMLLMLIVGCGGATSETKTSLFEDDHEVAPHWPHDLDELSEKLRERISNADVNETSFAEIVDLVSWTAEVAADTSLSEEDWLPLYNASEALLPKLRRANGNISEPLVAQIEALCKLVDQASEQTSDEQTSEQTSEQSPEQTSEQAPEPDKGDS